MEEIKIFERPEFGSVRVVEKDLHIVQTLGGGQKMSIISEAGLYSLILRSRKKEAKEFKRWVTHDILPSIRKTGSYSASQYEKILPCLEDTAKRKKSPRSAMVRGLFYFIEKLIPPNFSAAQYAGNFSPQFRRELPALALGNVRLITVVFLPEEKPVDETSRP